MAIWMVRCLLDVDVWLNGWLKVFQRLLNGDRDSQMSIRGA